MHKLTNIFLVACLILGLKTGSARCQSPSSTTEVTAVIRQSCISYAGPEPCYTSLAAWEAHFGGIDFGAAPQGDLVSAGLTAVARIEGTWTQADTTPLALGGWTTDASHYILIYTTPEARHKGTPNSGYRLQTSGDRPIYSSVAYFRVEGLDISGNTCDHLIYLNPNTDEGVGEIHFSHNLIHGNGTSTASGLMSYSLGGTLYAWNNVIYGVGEPGYTAGIQTGGGTAYLYNNTIAGITSGFAIRSGGVVVAKNNLTDAPGEDFYGSYYPGSDFNASSDDSAPGFHSRLNQTFSFVNPSAGNYHLAASDGGARNYGLDLSHDPVNPIADDIDGVARSGGWDIGADEAASGTDSVPPIRFNGAPSGELPSDTTQVTLALDTAENAICRYATGEGVAYNAMPNTFENTGGITHTQLISGLHDEQSYTFAVKCQDTATNTNNDDFLISFSIDSADVTPPVISNVQVNNITPYTAEVTWTTDEPTTSQVAFGSITGDSQFTVLDTTLVAAHSVLLRGLDASTLYQFRARSIDIGDNETVSDESDFTTAALGSFYYVDANHPQTSDLNPGTQALPWLTIQHAADIAQPGDTIFVEPGNYGRTVIEHGGAAGQYITFKGTTVPNTSLVNWNARFDPAHPVQTPGNPAVNAVTKGFDLHPAYPGTTPVGYVRIENFEITAIYQEGGSNARGGIRLANTGQVQIVGNFLHDLNPKFDGYDYIGIRGEGHDNIEAVIKDNILYRVQGTGIGIVGQDWLVEGNNLSHGLDANTDTGAHVGGDSDAMRFFGSGHAIRNNFMHDYLDEEQYGDPHIDCFQSFSVYPDSQFAHDILIEGNTCDDFGQMLMIEDSSEVNGTGNEIHHITFRNNIFRHARAFAIQGGRADHFTFVNNIIADSHYGGFGLSNNPYLTVYNNIFYNNGSGSQINDNASKIGSVWDYNLHYPDFSWPSKQPEYDQHSLFGIDPRFRNPSAGDYHLRTFSPAIDQGIPLSGFNYDKEFLVRPQIAGWDIGPYEAMPEVELVGLPADKAIILTWTINVALPATTTWTIDYQGTPGDQASPITEIPEPARTFILTGLTNYEWYTVTLQAIADGAPTLTDTVRVMPTDYIYYMPLAFQPPTP
ncbi:MAG: right-handed parallel beta-helix repeat-containing protein [Anaerolineales bacterium]|nr:right-handed parallel beta-helix repeat-containing protein [Anaerolineales bacterium]